ncbi:phage tail protein [Paracoccus aminophilus]|uniref:Tip attachment protein J domain-containing protein n=1 Tax=Paracoccus aminophilus JCM 7686 TaxID=1367847 RepID=S5YSZ4_PARAH|nr:hypothetical protein [Paracoccus aminophilus]AGT08356.1 hypothetical protein JCM7686_1254 [Paracoccus aminophilus JCM 7686]AGT10539.1 hypothetical protein JCM7686_1997 [Paracoccus aminophilus JCM 7686]
MPQVGAWLVATWSAQTVVGFALRTAAAIALNMAVAKVTQPKGPKPRDLQTELRDSNAQRIRHLGRVRASGAAMFWDWAQVGGQRRLFKLLAMGQGGISAVETVWLNDKEVTLSGTAVTSKPYDGVVSIDWRSGQSALQSGGAYAALQAAFPGWTPNHRLRGVGTILGTFDAVKGDKISEIYSGGDPQISALIKGDACHNPITGDATWSDNIAVQARDVLTHPSYGPLRLADLDTASFAQAIADCEDPIPRKAPGTARRYIGGGSYALSEPVVDVLRRLEDASAGRFYITSEGKLGFRVGKWRAPNYTIREEHIVSLDIGPGSGEFERVTTLVPKYVAPEIGWQQTSADPWDDAAALALYGESAAKEIDFPWVQSHGQARRLAKIKMAKLNPSWRATVRLRFWGLLLLEEETVRLHLPELGLINASAWIDGFAFDAEGDDGVVTVQLIAADPASFSWTAAEEGDPPSVPEKVEPGQQLLAAPVISSLTIANNDGPPYIRIEVDPIDGPYYLGGYYRRAGSSFRYGLEVQDIRVGGKLVARSLPNADRGEYEIGIGWYSARPDSGAAPGGNDAASEITTVTGIEVVANTTPPDAPQIISKSGTAGGTLTVIMAPDLGANYYRTGLWRAAPAAPFSAAVFQRWNYDTSSEVAITASIPSEGARYWLRSENQSGKTSAEVLVGQYLP